jgi:threonine synthase
VTVAVLRALAARGAFHRDATVVAYITGTGLKTTEALDGALAPVVRIGAGLREFERHVLDRVLA